MILVALGMVYGDFRQQCLVHRCKFWLPVVQVDPSVKTPLEKAAVPLLEERQNRLSRDQQAEGEADVIAELDKRVTDLTARLRKKTERIDELEAKLSEKEEEHRLLSRDRHAQDAQWSWSLTDLHKREPRSLDSWSVENLDFICNDQVHFAWLCFPLSVFSQSCAFRRVFIFMCSSL